MRRRLPTLVNIGMKIDRKSAQEKLGFDEPEGDEDLLKPTQQAAPKVGAFHSAEQIAAASAINAPTAKADPPVLMANMLDASLQPAMTAWINKIGDLVKNAKTLEDIRDGLHALAPSMTLDQFTTAMRQALAAASLAGRYEILREAGSV
jgi:phage gp29-like protein